MRRALRQAVRAVGIVSPNPAVGATLVKDGRIVGEGFTQPPGGPHAEIMALRQAGESARGSTLYVTLEPCSHYGRTPPCADAILEAGVRRVVASIPDPNPLVAGQGFWKLREAGAEVEVGLCAEEATRLNEAFLTYVRFDRPFVTLKVAATLDGKIASRSGDSRWISSDVSRAYVHRLRRRVDAVMIGIGTALKDNPRLTPRPPGKARDGRPVRVVVDSRARLKTDSALFQDLARYPLLVAAGAEADPENVKRLTRYGAEVIVSPGEEGRVDLPGVLRQLGERNLQSVLLEGGGELAAAALEANLIDKTIFFYAPKLIGGRKAKTVLEGEGAPLVSLGATVHRMSARRSGPDLRVEGYLHTEIFR
jgi:diaminohydroxyphosphoribosylaminopyrimidine deaminase/5-amino-6-(5-phosphoribosylamino)uracil reductase